MCMYSLQLAVIMIIAVMLLQLTASTQHVFIPLHQPLGHSLWHTNARIYGPGLTDDQAK